MKPSLDWPTLFDDTTFNLPPAHTAVPYPLARLWGLDKSVDGSGWWAWKCTCGRDVGAEQRAAYSSKTDAQQMADHHMLEVHGA